MGILGYQNARGTLEKEITKALNAVVDNKTFILKKWSEDQLADVKNLASKLAVRDLLSPPFSVGSSFRSSGETRGTYLPYVRASISSIVLSMRFEEFGNLLLELSLVVDEQLSKQTDAASPTAADDA